MHLVPLLKHVVNVEVDRRMVADLVVDDAVKVPQAREIEHFAVAKQVDHVARQVVKLVDVDAVASVGDDLVQVPTLVHAVRHVMPTHVQQPRVNFGHERFGENKHQEKNDSLTLWHRR